MKSPRISVLVLHNIRSVHNAGSMFRTADAAGVSRIILSGYTPLPVDRFGVPRKDFIKVSLGAEKTVAWSQTKTVSQALKQLRKNGFHIVALEQDKRSIPLFDLKMPQNLVALIVGNEVRGLSPQALAQCDSIVEIPMRGKKESLNVSVAAGIAIFGLQR